MGNWLQNRKGIGEHMQKQKRIFTTAFIVLLIIITSSVLLLYDNVKKNTDKRMNIKDTQVNQTLQLYTLAKAKELDPQYKVISFQENLPLDIQNQLRYALDDAMQNAVFTLENDPNFICNIKNTQTNKRFSHREDRIKKTDDLKSYRLYSTMKYDKNGRLEDNPNVNALHYSTYNI